MPFRTDAADSNLVCTLPPGAFTYSDGVTVCSNGVYTGPANLSLMLTNLQLTNTEAYQLRASNASGMLWSGASSLVVSDVPSAFNNVITSFAVQTGLSYRFTRRST